MHHHKTYMYINFQQNCAHKCIHKKIASCIKDGRTDGTTDVQTDRHCVRQQSVVFSKKNNTKNKCMRGIRVFFCYAKMYSENSARLNKTKIRWKGIIFVLILIYHKFHYDSVYFLTSM